MKPSLMRRFAVAATTCLAAALLAATCLAATAHADEPSAWDGTSVDTEWSGTGTKTDPYLISSAAELAGLAQQVNGGTTFRTLYIRVTCDIDLGNYNWDPIGYSMEKSFQGIFNGGGHVISGLNVNVASRGGLFGEAMGATIKNVVVRGSVKATNGMVGGIVGIALCNTSIKNCGNEASIYAQDALTGNCGAGGIVGEMLAYTSGYTPSISGCYNTGDVTVEDGYSGGILGFGQGYSTGYINIKNCYNLGTLTTNRATEDNAYLGGGICSYVSYINIKNCYSAAECYYTNSSRHFMGGICGYVGSTYACTITDCSYLTYTYYAGDNCFEGRTSGANTTMPISASAFTAADGLTAEAMGSEYAGSQTITLKVNGQATTVTVPKLAWESLRPAPAGWSKDIDGYWIYTYADGTQATGTLELDGYAYELGSVGELTNGGWSEWKVTKAATCEEAGEQIRVNVDGTTEAQTSEIAATGHAWGKPVITFAADGKTATATWACTIDATHTLTQSCNVTGKVTKAATCTAAGTTTYTASVTGDKDAGLQAGTATTTRADVPATGHTWGAPVITFAADGKTATATWTCTSGDATITRACTVTSKVTAAATCTAMGQTTYTATASGTDDAGAALPTGTASTALRDIAKTQHTWGEPAITTMASPTAKGVTTITCNRCGATITDDLNATGWIEFEGSLYFLGAGSLATTGWSRCDSISDWYWFDADGAMATGWSKCGTASSWYYLGTDGVMATGWQKVGSSWYWFAASGKMTTGWKKLGGSYYYFKASGAMATGWLKLSGTYYYLAASGKMVTGWKQISGSYYWFKASGAMATGWQKIKGTWYWFAASGKMAAGTTLTIDGKKYTFAKSGALQ